MAKNTNKNVEQETEVLEQTVVLEQNAENVESTELENAKVLEQRERAIEKEIEKEERTMKQRLAAEPKRTIFIPEDPLNPNDVVPVGVNGVIYAIPRGKEFEVPKSIYETWMYSYKKTLDAQRKIDVRSLNQEIQILD